MPTIEVHDSSEEEHDKEEEESSPVVGQFVGGMDPSHQFKCSEAKRTGKDGRQKNCKWKCMNCATDGILSADRMNHVRQKHPELLTSYQESCGSRKKKSDPPTTTNHIVNMLGAKPEKPEVNDASTLNRWIIILLVALRLPFCTVESPIFKALIRCAILYGKSHSSSNYQVPSRRTLVDNHLEDVTKETISQEVELFEPIARKYGAWLAMDGATDINGVSNDVMILQNVSTSLLFHAAHPLTSTKTSAWTAKNAAGALEGKVDFETMGLRDGGDDDDSDSDSETKGENGGKKLKVTQGLKDAFIDLHGLGKYVHATIGDNCNTAVLAGKKLEDSHGLVRCGDVSHAFAKLYQHMLALTPLKQGLECVLDVIRLFLTYRLPRALVKARSGKQLKRLVETRFVSGHSSMERIKELKDTLLEVIHTKDFKEWAKKQRGQLEELIQKVLTTLQDTQFWKQIDFVLELGVGFIVAVRLFDGAKAGSACLVYKVWSMLGGTLVAAFNKHKGESFASEQLFNSIKALISEDWKKFHYPVFSAAFLCTPLFHAEVADMSENERSLLMVLKQETIDVSTVMLRRYEFENGVDLRKKVLEKDDPHLAKLSLQLEQEFEGYLNGNHEYQYLVAKYKHLPPADFWYSKAPDGLLCRVMCRICALAPSTCSVERMHKLFKATRTKYRNCLGYFRAMAINFVASRNAAKFANTELDWGEISKYKARFEELSAHDRQYLDSIFTTEAEAERVVRDLEEEEARDVEDATVQLTIAQGASALNITDQLNGADAGNDGDDDTLEEEEKAVIVQMRSSRGRIIRPKAFAGFVV